MSKIQSLTDLQIALRESLLAYNQYLLDDIEACGEEHKFAYVQQRLNQVEEFYPVMTEILMKASTLTPFKE
jgi:hypothetical protein